MNLAVTDLPTRRPAQTLSLIVANNYATITFGYHPDSGRLVEVFIKVPKAPDTTQEQLRVFGQGISRLLALGRSPASIKAELIDNATQTAGEGAAASLAVLLEPLFELIEDAA